MFTKEQLIAAMIEWERRVRANPEGFMSIEKMRAEPVEVVGQDAAAYVIAIMEGK